MVATLASATTLDAQTEWQEVELLERLGGVTAYDIQRDRLVLHRVAASRIATETWEFDGNEWIRRSSMHAPPPSPWRAMVYDAARGRTLLFGGANANDTWQWDGVDWTRSMPASAPPARNAPALAFDSARGRVVLFGGFTSIFKSVTHFSDTWEWDGTNWSPFLGASPPGRTGHRMVFDRARARIVLFGGSNRTFFGGGDLGDTWEFDGNAWISRASTTRPNARSDHGMVYDHARARTMVFGGTVGATSVADMWEWDGNQWVGPMATGVSARTGAAMEFDTQRNRVLLFGGNDVGFVHADLWQADRGVFSRLLDSSTPPARHSAAAAFDERRRRLMVFSGHGGSTSLQDHWEFDGTRWHTVAGVLPPARGRAAMVYDSRRDRTVLFGGELPGFAADTWQWDGIAWHNLQPPTSPPARLDHAMTFDRARGEIVLFGGLGVGGALGDTWTFDGATWTQRQPSQSPAGRGGHTMAYDSLRGEVVLFGGANPFPRNDTWVWDGADWALRTPAVSPSPRTEHAMDYDALRGRVVLFGGGWTNSADTWEWDGAQWQRRSPARAPVERQRHNLVYDPLTARCWLFGGSTNLSNAEDSWSYGAIAPAAAVGFGSGCVGSAGQPVLAARSLGWLGDTMRCEVGPTPANALVLFWIGESATQWQGLPLPLDLAFAGLPGCSILSGPTLTFFRAASGARAQFDVAVPSSSTLVGADVFAQSLIADPLANAAGAVTTNGLRLRLGAR
jgi:hypothetical protein